VCFVVVWVQTSDQAKISVWASLSVIDIFTIGEVSGYFFSDYLRGSVGGRNWFVCQFAGRKQDTLFSL
jgi:hypothetical protein